MLTEKHQASKSDRRLLLVEYMITEEGKE